jgi:hypothetical protein
LLAIGKLFQSSLTNTNLLQKSINHGRKKFYNIGPGIATDPLPDDAIGNKLSKLSSSCPGNLLKLFSPALEMTAKPGNTKGGSITVPLTSCLTGLDWSVLQIKTKIVSCHTADSKPVKQEVNGTVILPPLVFPGQAGNLLSSLVLSVFVVTVAYLSGALKGTF